jgi:nanoRNase/pAp phosphatase (c-di-AMP/oligoRNAs hydrolase)
MVNKAERVDIRETPPDRGKEAELAEVLEGHHGERHIVVLQDYPDPDAISSALAHQIISGQHDIGTDIVYGRKISHQQNRAMVRLLGIDVLHCEETLRLERYDGAVFADKQGTTANRILKALGKAGVPPLVVVDHHEPQEELQAEFTDIRRTCGATASIYSEYLENGLPEMDKGNRDHVMLATAPTHGILTDTVGFVRARREDFQAAAFLSSFKDADLLEQVMTQARSRQTMEIIHRAF